MVTKSDAATFKHGDARNPGPRPIHVEATATPFPPLPSLYGFHTQGDQSQKGVRKPYNKSSPYRGVTLFRPTMKWRAQISANGKTTSLGDHETEEQAARAFDRAAINKGGNARTNFSIRDYEDEIADLQAMSQSEMVAMLRSKARKVSVQTSHCRGVSLLKQTQKWHAQINVGGKQVHLGFFSTENEAARAYDRAAINKGARDGSRIVTNMAIKDYEAELDLLCRIPRTALLDALANEQRRVYLYELLASGSLQRGIKLFGPSFDSEGPAAGVTSVEEILVKAERAQPKPTAENPLYANFGKRKKGAEGLELPLIIRFADPPAPVARPPSSRCRRALFSAKPKPSSNAGHTTSSDDEPEDYSEGLQDGGSGAPTRRSARTAGKIVKHYGRDGEEEDDDNSGASESGEVDMETSPRRNPFQASASWGLTSPSQGLKSREFGHKDGPEGQEHPLQPKSKRKTRRERRVVNVQPVAAPSWDLLAYAVAAVRQSTEEQAAADRMQGGLAASTRASAPSVDAILRINSLGAPNSAGAPTAGSRATAAPSSLQPQPIIADKGSQALVRPQSGYTVSGLTVEAREEAARDTPSNGYPPEPPTPSIRLQQEDRSPGSCQKPCSSFPPLQSQASSVEQGSAKFQDAAPLRDSIQADCGNILQDKVFKAGKGLTESQSEGEAVEAVSAVDMPIKPDGSAFLIQGSGKIPLPRRSLHTKAESLSAELKGRGLQGRQKRRHPAFDKSQDSARPKFTKPLTKRQKALRRREEIRHSSKLVISAHAVDKESSPTISYAEGLKASSRLAETANRSRQSDICAPTEVIEAHSLEEDAASQCLPKACPSQIRFQEQFLSSHTSQASREPSAELQLQIVCSRQMGSNRRKRKQPARSAG